MAFFFKKKNFFRFRDIYFFCELSDDVIGGFNKAVQHSIKNISRNIKAVFFKLDIRIVHHKTSKMTPVMPSSLTLCPP